MVEERSSRDPSEAGEISASNFDNSQLRRSRKKRWDQPAESFVASGVTASIFTNPANVAAVNTKPGVAALASGTVVTIPVLGSFPAIPVHASPIPAVSQEIVKPRIQDELLIARDIVINDAEPAVRYQLTRRQMQEEIQKSTGAVVITRGRYHQPNAPLDAEKPLYLHISAGAHLKDTPSRILAVDRAASMVEEILNSGAASSSLSTSCLRNGFQAFSTCVYLGFNADPALKIADRICGPNGQYLNHIINETGATVMLKGKGSEGYDAQSNGGSESLHLFISSSNAKSLEDAKKLAENLLDAIAFECGKSRISSSVPYGPLPTGPQLLCTETTLSSKAFVSLAPSNYTIPLPPSSSSVSHDTTPSSLKVVNPLLFQPTFSDHSQSLISGGTSYNGYGGIYPQATPLQQVAIALKHSTSNSSTIAPSLLSAATTPQNSSANFNSDIKSHSQKRKFQEYKEAKILNSGDKSIQSPPSRSPSNLMPPPPPPPPLKDDNLISGKTTTIPETLIKLMEYGEEEEDEEEANVSVPLSNPKPFWAV